MCCFAACLCGVYCFWVSSFFVFFDVSVGCATGYTGTANATVCTVAGEAYTLNGCADTNGCAAGPSCGDNAVCQDNNAPNTGYTCVCESGYSGSDSINGPATCTLTPPTLSGDGGGGDGGQRACNLSTLAPPTVSNVVLVVLPIAGAVKPPAERNALSVIDTFVLSSKNRN